MAAGYWTTRGPVISRSGQLVDATSIGILKHREQMNTKTQISRPTRKPKT